ncbi:hypothetical protein RUM43_002017 [Polyplax serrata]|uniref:Uncharacterized protein n=1 Tax=Polyplax serrata TaxID=468196 RepID=A0AAN8S2E9_POLSC
MADDNPEVTEKEEAGEHEQDQDAAEGYESTEGEGRHLEVFPESEKSLEIDFCKEEEVSEEEFGEDEWLCQEIYGEGEGYPEVPYPEVFGEEEESGISLEEKRSLDSEYLKRVLGTPLTYALLDIATRRPTDPIQYLGHYLLRWRWCGENKEKYENCMKELNEERNAYLEKMKEKQRQAMLLQEQLKEELRRAEKVESSLEITGEIGELEQIID